MSTSTWTSHPLTTERLTLRPWLVDDAQAWGHGHATETTKYFGVELQVFRLRAADLDQAAPTAPQPPHLSGD